MLGRLKYKLIYGIASFVYYRFAIKLPASYVAKTNFPKRLRAWCGKYLLNRCGKQVNIEKNVELRWGGIELGDYSGIGEGSIIGGNTIIGNNVTLYQGVTLGGTGKEHGKRRPTICDNVMISAGAKVLGSFTVGENSKIGAGSVVLEEVPPNCTVVGVPGRIVKRDNIAIPRDTMDQIHLPDPVKEDINRLQSANVQLLEKLEALEAQMAELKKNVK